MSRNPHPSRSSRSSRRSPSSSPLPSSQRHLPSDDFTSPAPANRHSPHPSANVVAGQLPVPPPSIPAHQYAPFAQQHAYVDQCSIPRDPYHSSHLISSNPSLTMEQQPLWLPQGPLRAGGSFNHAHNFTMTNPVFIDVNAPVDNFMKDLLQHTIIGAEFDSSARDPPPRCHPGTRLTVLQRCLNFIFECHGEEKLRWLVGPAGVGKSAVMQMVVEKVPDGVIFASIFLSLSGRRDGTKAILTIAYQLAVKWGPYSQFIRDEVTLDPSLLQKSLPIQFNKFIVEPFIHLRLFHSPRQFLIAIDGLDECDDPLTQQNLLELITNFCISYPTSPIAWIVASRPEPHITSFFDRVEVQPAFIKEEIPIDSDEACGDVQRYLRDELSRIKLAKPSLRHRREWPSELEFTTIASAAGGLFAYAAVVVRYIDNPYYRDPTTQLRHVLEVIGGIPLVNISGRGHPMAQLDALYARILSNIPLDLMVNVREMLLLCSPDAFEGDFRYLCNFLGFSEDTAYGAISYLCSVMRVPEADKADDERLEYFHKSFEDFLFDPERSGFSHNVDDEIEQLKARTCLKIVEQVPHGLAGGDGIICYPFGTLQGGPGVCDNILLSWPADERLQMTDADLRRDLYSKSMYELCSKFYACRPFHYGSMSCFQALTTRFSALNFNFPSSQLRHCAFDKLRHELAELGKLKEVPLRALDYAAIGGAIDLRFTSPPETDFDLSHHWNPSCRHEKCELHRLQQRWGWKTEFQVSYLFDSDSEDSSGTLGDRAGTHISLRRFKPCHKSLFSLLDYIYCDYCSRRFVRHFIRNLDVLATVFVDSTGLSYVEYSFVDPDDGVSEWRYRFCHSGPPRPIDV